MKARLEASQNSSQQREDRYRPTKSPVLVHKIQTNENTYKQKSRCMNYSSQDSQGSVMTIEANDYVMTQVQMTTKTNQTSQNNSMMVKPIIGRRGQQLNAVVNAHLQLKRQLKIDNYQDCIGYENQNKAKPKCEAMKNQTISPMVILEGKSKHYETRKEIKTKHSTLTRTSKPDMPASLTVKSVFKGQGQNTNDFTKYMKSLQQEEQSMTTQRQKNPQNTGLKLNLNQANIQLNIAGLNLQASRKSVITAQAFDTANQRTQQSQAPQSGLSRRYDKPQVTVQQVMNTGQGTLKYVSLNHPGQHRSQNPIQLEDKNEVKLQRKEQSVRNISSAHTKKRLDNNSKPSSIRKVQKGQNSDLMLTENNDEDLESKFGKLSAAPPVLDLVSSGVIQTAVAKTKSNDEQHSPDSYHPLSNSNGSESHPVFKVDPIIKKNTAKGIPSNNCGQVCSGFKQREEKSYSPDRLSRNGYINGGSRGLILNRTSRIFFQPSIVEFTSDFQAGSQQRNSVNGIPAKKGTDKGTTSNSPDNNADFQVLFQPCTTGKLQAMSSMSPRSMGTGSNHLTNIDEVGLQTLEEGQKSEAESSQQNVTAQIPMSQGTRRSLVFVQDNTVKHKQGEKTLHSDSESDANPASYALGDTQKGETLIDSIKLKSFNKRDSGFASHQTLQHDGSRAFVKQIVPLNSNRIRVSHKPSEPSPRLRDDLNQQSVTDINKKLQNELQGGSSQSSVPILGAMDAEDKDIKQDFGGKKSSWTVHNQKFIYQQEHKHFKKSKLKAYKVQYPELHEQREKAATFTRPPTAYKGCGFVRKTDLQSNDTQMFAPGRLTQLRQRRAQRQAMHSQASQNAQSAREQFSEFSQEQQYPRIDNKTFNSLNTILNQKLNCMKEQNVDLEFKNDDRDGMKKGGGTQRNYSMTSTSSYPMSTNRTNSTRKANTKRARNFRATKTLMDPSHMKDYFGQDKFRMTEFLKDMQPKKEKVLNEDSDDDLFDAQANEQTRGEKNEVVVDADFEALSKDQRRHMKYFKDQAMALVVPGYLQHVFDIEL